MTNRGRSVLHPGSGSSSRVRRVRARRGIRVSLGAHGRAWLAVLLVAATPAPLRHGSEGRGAGRPCTSESTISLEHRLHKGALTAPICRSLFSERLFSSIPLSHKTPDFCDFPMRDCC